MHNHQQLLDGINYTYFRSYLDVGSLEEFRFSLAECLLDRTDVGSSVVRAESRLERLVGGAAAEVSSIGESDITLSGSWE